MTEEEKARNFAMNEMRYGDVEYDVPKSPIKIAEQAYLAGLHEGQPKWHFMKDVQCYEDLPTNKDVLYVYEVNKGAFDKLEKEWKAGSLNEFEFDVMAYHVIRWCEIEIPQFKE